MPDQQKYCVALTAQQRKDYKKERYDPTLPFCHGRPELHFDGSQLLLTAANGTVRRIYPAVAGKRIWSDTLSFDYSAFRQREEDGDLGPIPEGVYWINPSEVRAYEGNNREGWGRLRLTIHPFTTTDTFCRGGFFIHGGTVPGSGGCVDLTNHIIEFVADLLHLIGGYQSCQIHLTVKYINASTKSLKAK